MHHEKLRLAMRTTVTLIALLGLNTIAHAGYGNLIELKIANGDSKAAKFQITPGNCAFIQEPLKLELTAGQAMRIGFTHDPGSRCDGVSGAFELTIEGNNLKTYFLFNENGPLWLEPNPPTTAYVGKQFTRLGGGSQGGGEFLWESLASPKLTADKPQGSWEHICSQFCEITLKQEITSSSSTDKTTSQETTTALAIALEAGIEFSGASAKTSVTASQEQKLGSSLSQSISSGKLQGKEQKIGLTADQMEEKDIFAIWQWLVTTRLSDGTSTNLTTVMYTCTPDSNPPTYLPGSDQDIKACRKKAPAAAATAPAQQPQ